MLPQQQFKVKLGDIARAYSAYIDRIIQEENVIPSLTFKFSVLLTMIQDLYYGSLKHQESARNLLIKMDLNKVNKALFLPDGMLQKLIYSPETYAENIIYEEELEENDILI